MFTFEIHSIADRIDRVKWYESVTRANENSLAICKKIDMALHIRVRTFIILVKYEIDCETMRLMETYNLRKSITGRIVSIDKHC